MAFVRDRRLTKLHNPRDQGGACIKHESREKLSFTKCLRAVWRASPRARVKLDSMRRKIEENKARLLFDVSHLHRPPIRCNENTRIVEEIPMYRTGYKVAGYVNHARVACNVLRAPGHLCARGAYALAIIPRSHAQERKNVSIGRDD